MKKTLLIIAFLALCSGAFWLFAPPYVKDKLYGVVTFNTPERQCFKEHLNSFHDPATAYIDGSYTWTKDDEVKSGGEEIDLFKNTNEIIRVKVRAKNKMGAYTATYVGCYMFGSAGVVAFTD